MKKIILGLGSNRPWNNMSCPEILEKAIIELGTYIRELRCASFYETEPIPKTDQNNFINTAVSGLYFHSPQELLKRVNETEAMFGRDRSTETRWGQRSLDIDILLFGDLVLWEPDLVTPHPELEKRRFALEPLLELWPDACSPKTKTPYCKICNDLPDQGVKKIYESR